ncbi:dodecin domain-containing protein [Euzebya tangerina]|uniref:dodecin domain-containing protein n=1 Tax=Euzebya tangerina TaxID=591198 RepID=UPI000E318AEF|nr:dodecin domain-containing protein [Euzebya tangerina]
MPVLNSIELEGVSDHSWDDAAREAVREAARTIRRITRLDVLSTGASVTADDTMEFRTTIRLYFEIDRPAV